jgi:hypothetical protein
VDQFEADCLNLVLCGVQFGVAAGDLLAQPMRLGGFSLCLIDELLNGVGNPTPSTSVLTGAMRLAVGLN